MPALLSGVCSTSFWGDTMNKLPYFLVALCLCMFCSFSAYADDAADPAQADSAASSDEVVVPPEEGKVVQVQGVQTYDPQLYERMDKLQESIDALTEALVPTAEGAESSAEDAGGQELYLTAFNDFWAACEPARSCCNVHSRKCRRT